MIRLNRRQRKNTTVLLNFQMESRDIR